MAVDVVRTPPEVDLGARLMAVADVVERYNVAMNLSLTAQQKADLVQYLLSL